MRVLHVYSGNLYGGVETLLLNLARGRHLCPEMDPHFALSFKGQIAEELCAAGVPVHALGAVRTRLPWTVLQARMCLRDLLKRERFDVVVCHSAWSQAIFGPIVRSADLSLVLWLHDAIRHPSWLDRWAGMTPPDLVLCNSQFTSKTLPLIYPAVANRVLYCPVVAAISKDTEYDRRTLRKQLGAWEEDVVILQVSRLEPWKGQALLLSALNKLREIPNWICWQVGGPQRPHEAQYFEGLKRYAKELGIADRVQFLGQRRDVPSIMTAADIYCQPNSGPEPFGIALIEALLAGLPIVTTAMGGALEIVDESCGILVPPRDIEAFASALHRFIEDGSLRAAVGACGPGRAAKLCDPVGQMGQLYDALTSVMMAAITR